MKIIFFIDDLTSGGAQRQMVNLAIAFRRECYSVSVITYYKRDYYKKSLIEEGIEAKCFPETNAVKRILKIRKEILSRKPDVVFSYMLIPNFIACLSTVPVKKFELIVGERSADPKLLSSFKSRFLRYFHARADYIVTNSKANKDLLDQVVPFYTKKIRVIYNMIDLETWKPLENFRFRESGKLRLVVAASHRYLKNCMTLVKAISLLPDNEREQLEVVWYGKSLERPYLDGSINEVRVFVQKQNLEKMIKFQPATSDILTHMQKADLIGLFSFFEGLPNVVCEGMSLGKPILASSVSDVPTIVVDHRNGRTFTPYSAEELKDRLSFFINCSVPNLMRMGDNSRKMALELFDQEIIYQQFKALVAEIHD